MRRTVLATALTAVTWGAYIVSGWRFLQLRYTNAAGERSYLSLRDGQLDIGRWTVDWSFPHVGWGVTNDPLMSDAPRFRWSFELLRNPGSLRLEAVVIPLWAIAIPMTALDVWLLRRARRAARRARASCCPACAYPRRGLPASAPCPECGGPTAMESPDP